MRTLSASHSALYCRRCSTMPSSTTSAILIMRAIFRGNRDRGSDESCLRRCAAPCCSARWRADLAARFKAQGCVAAIASSSVLTDLLIGKIARGNERDHRRADIGRSRWTSSRVLSCRAALRGRGGRAHAKTLKPRGIADLSAGPDGLGRCFQSVAGSLILRTTPSSSVGTSPTSFACAHTTCLAPTSGEASSNS